MKVLLEKKMDKEKLREEFHKLVIPKIIWKKMLGETDKRLLKEWKERFNIDEEIFNYYTDKRILFQIVKYLGNKELCFDSKIRWLYASKISYLLYDFYFYKILESPKSMYCGLSGFKNRPRAPYNPREKKDWQDNFWTSKENPTYFKLINFYDFAIDLDADNFKTSYEDAKKLFNFFKKYNLKFSVWCSGKKGWHFRIPFSEYKELIKPFSIDNCIVFCKALALDIKDKLKLKNIDLVIYSATRFIKLPFSLDKRNKNVIYPLTDSEFLNFKVNYLNTNYILNKKDLGFIDVYYNRKSNPKGFQQMVKEL